MTRDGHTDDIILLRCCGEEISPYLDAAARLRIGVFREYPYLYDGSAAYEAGYLRRYLECPESLFVCALAAGEVIGVSTALPLAAADEAFQQPFVQAGVAVESLYYLGESCLLPEYRGRGIGHAFFDHRESRARELGYAMTTFCSVLRPPDHPHKPQDYRSHEWFWRKRGYHPNDLVAELEWEQIDAAGEVKNRLEFWQKQLG
jgi:GNAT superfamily N-acetyltransferase